VVGPSWAFCIGSNLPIQNIVLARLSKFVEKKDFLID
jgi:hypothetical protein